MSSGIMELSNSLIYGNRLCCGSLEIANAKLKFSGKQQVHFKFKEVTLPFCSKFSILNIETSCYWKLGFVYPSLSYCHVSSFSNLLLISVPYSFNCRFWIPIGLSSLQTQVFLINSTSYILVILCLQMLTIWPNHTDQVPALEAKEHRTVNNPTEAYIVSWVCAGLRPWPWAIFHAFLLCFSKQSLTSIATS